MSSILVVDDEDQIRRLICQTLEGAGYHVTEARDGKEALRLYRLAPADLVLWTFSCPIRMSGDHRRIEQESPDVKIIVITGGSDMIEFLHYFDVATMLGAHRTVQKPFEMKTLLETIHAELQAPSPHAAYSLRAPESLKSEDLEIVGWPRAVPPQPFGFYDSPFMDCRWREASLTIGRRIAEVRNSLEP